MLEKIKLFLDIIIFNNFIDNKIKKDYLKKYLKEFFLLKNLIIKFICLTITTLICGLIFFLIRQNLLSNPNASITFNKGVAFSSLNDVDQWIVYLIKSLISIVFSLIFIFFNKWFIFIPAYLIAINGWFNIIDKTIIDVFNGISYIDSVVDYVYINNSVSNSADIFIIIGICCIIAGILWYIYLINKEQKANNKN